MQKLVCVSVGNALLPFLTLKNEVCFASIISEESARRTLRKGVTQNTSNEPLARNIMKTNVKMKAEQLF
jgi:hypothetical protein